MALHEVERMAWALQTVKSRPRVEHRHAGVAHAAQRRYDFARERLAALVVTESGIEQVAHHVHRGRRLRRSPGERVERGERSVALGREVKVGDEKCRCAWRRSACTHRRMFPVAPP